MPEKAPRSPRYRKRVPVRFGATPEMTGRGFTINVSATGMAIATSSLPKLGGRLYLEFVLGPRGACRAEGQIMWAQRGLGTAGTLGIRIVRADEEYFQFVWKLAPERNGTATPLPPLESIPKAPVEEPKAAPKRTVLFIPPAIPPVPRIAPEQQTQPEVLEQLPDYLRMEKDEGVPRDEDFDVPDWWATPEDEAAPSGQVPAKPIDRAPRIEAKLRMQFGVGIMLDREGATLNLSETGLAAAVPGEVEPGELVVFEISGERGACRGSGWVVWVRDVASEPPERYVGVRLILGDTKYRELVGAITSPAVAQAG